MVRRSFFEGRRLRTAFLISLTINFFFMAFGISVYLDRPFSFPPAPDQIVERLSSNLSAEGSETFLDTFEKHRPDIMARHSVAKQSNAKVRAVVGAEELDMEALRAAREQMRQEMLAFMLELDGCMVEVVPELSAEDRRRLSEAVPR